jgi:anti-repressor protein
MNDLIKVETNSNGSQVVSARELHKFLEVKTDFTDWCKRMFDYGFELDSDYSLLKIGEGSAHNKINYALTLDCAKEISMIQRSEKGKQARKYFIECEKIAKDMVEINPPKKLPQTYSEALRELADVTEQKLMLEQRNEKLEPRSTYFEQMIMTDGLISMEQAAKLLNIKDMGRNNLFKALRTGNVIQKHNTSPKQYYIDKGYFELKEDIIEFNSVTKAKRVRKVIVTTFVTQKGLAFLFKFFGLTKKSLPN